MQFFEMVGVLGVLIVGLCGVTSLMVLGITHILKHFNLFYECANYLARRKKFNKWLKKNNPDKPAH